MRMAVLDVSSPDAAISVATSRVGLITDGSSRSFKYSGPDLGCGTGSAEPRNPSGTFTGSLNRGSLDTESIKNKFAPLSLHAKSCVAGHFNSLSVGRRTRFASGNQSPAIPLELTRNCNGPKAEPPNAFAGFSVTTAT